MLEHVRNVRPLLNQLAAVLERDGQMFAMYLVIGGMRIRSNLKMAGWLGGFSAVA